MKSMRGSVPQSSKTCWLQSNSMPCRRSRLYRSYWLVLTKLTCQVLTSFLMILPDNCQYCVHINYSTKCAIAISILDVLLVQLTSWPSARYALPTGEMLKRFHCTFTLYNIQLTVSKPSSTRNLGIFKNTSIVCFP